MQSNIVDVTNTFTIRPRQHTHTTHTMTLTFKNFIDFPLVHIYLFPKFYENLRLGVILLTNRQTYGAENSTHTKSGGDINDSFKKS